MKKIMSVLVLLLILVGLVACSQTDRDSWDSIEERGYFIVGLDDTFAPMGFRDANDELGWFRRRFGN
ncbi:MAG: hypothetical protein MZU97_15265 [Bacillus subtilis]|nr:hypothetical protein [Bacillus subtilis]